MMLKDQALTTTSYRSSNSGYALALRAQETPALDNLAQAEIQHLLGSAFFNQNAILILHLDTGDQPFVLEPAPLTLVGRYTEDLPEFRSVDMTPFGAKAKGVSRQHALLRRSKMTISIEDVDSTNGTFLNGRRLIPHRPEILRDNDEIMLGALRLRVAFQYG
jgi:pSer/pThr/pTyr-binding forkhead associated (FHA) protein